MTSCERAYEIPVILKRILFLGIIVTCGGLIEAKPRIVKLTENSLQKMISTELKDPYAFSGLASYYNKVNLYSITEGRFQRVEEDSELKLLNDEWLVLSGRFEALVFKGGDFTVSVSSDDPKLSFSGEFLGYRVDKASIEQLSPELGQVRYGHLAWPFSTLAKWIESLLEGIYFLTPFGWGGSIVLLALILKVLCLPLSIWTKKLQCSVSRTKAALVPQIAAIKSKFSGEEAHKRIVAAHKQAGVSLFYTLKPMGATLIQIPILIAVFNALGEMPQLQGQTIWWVSDLSYPDSIGTLPVSLPLLGYEISLLPMLMTLVSILSSLGFKDLELSKGENEKKKIPLYLMAALFLLLFYPFPAAMVLYWTLNNVFHFIQERIVPS